MKGWVRSDHNSDINASPTNPKKKRTGNDPKTVLPLLDLLKYSQYSRNTTKKKYNSNEVNVRMAAILLECTII
jgi:hypothetical protein